jgi:predicted nucleotidyltransferase
VLPRVVEVLPAGWKYPDVCAARIQVDDVRVTTPGYRESPWSLVAPIRIDEETVGEIEVVYLEERPPAAEGPFLLEERKLLDTIAERVSHYVQQRHLRRALASYERAVKSASDKGHREWGVILDFLERTDALLLRRITRKMINHLCWNDVPEARSLLRDLAPRSSGASDERGENRPSQRGSLDDVGVLTRETFQVAARNLSESEILGCIQRWIREDKTSFLATTLERLDTSLGEVMQALDRFHSLAADEEDLPPPMRSVLRVSLLRRFFTDRLDFVNAAKKFVSVEDFHDLAQRIVTSNRSQGKLGGKSAGLFLAMRVVRAAVGREPSLRTVREPRTWHVTSDGLPEFIQHNNLEDLWGRKYMGLDEVRQDYPRIVPLFKGSPFPPQIVMGLSVALDELEGRPLIVRSSSLLEDRAGSAFAGKYKSLFLANLGTKRERLAALLDAIAEVYASVFGPDPIEYRAERGLLDVHEEMGIMIQEVVGQRVGPYWLPAFSGVAFGTNDYRWSPRIRREDGLIRMVPGLGTRAVDRLSDDFPTMIAPGQPDLRVNASPDEILRYSPRKLDVINLETAEFETIGIPELLRKHGSDYPRVRDVVSRVDGDHISRPIGLGLDFERDDFVVTFDGIVANTDFIAQIRALLSILQEAMGGPVDLEFASDGEHLYLLQCRAQSYSHDEAPSPIPRDLDPSRVIFSADRHVPNGRIRNITHIVYVRPEAYNAISDLERLKEVGRAVGRLNTLLPKRQFILMGPGRWGSRGDIRLGVSVTYSDINNTALLVEIARKKGSYVPDLSFGTHFFQDLVEAGIRYLPLYPDDAGTAFREPFLSGGENILPALLPEFAHLQDVLRVIDVPGRHAGAVLDVLMNADLDEAVGILTHRTEPERPAAGEEGVLGPRSEDGAERSEDHWRWRLFMAERIALDLDPGAFGVAGVYVFGSTKNATAGPASDLDLLVHFRGDDGQRTHLEAWLDGWSRCLAEVNYLRTGYRTDRLLDVHLVTDEDIDHHTSFAVKIGAVTDPARPLPLGPEVPGT